MAMICGSAVRCVCFTYSSNAPAAEIATVNSAQPNPFKSFVPNCLVSTLVAVSKSNCQLAMCFLRALCCAIASWLTLSAQTISAGLIRSNSCTSCPRATSLNTNSPEATFKRASPTNPSPKQIPNSTLSLVSSNKAASVSVPGVKILVTARSTGPLFAAETSPTCSQIATASPSLVSFAKYCSAA